MPPQALHPTMRIVSEKDLQNELLHQEIAELRETCEAERRANRKLGEENKKMKEDIRQMKEDKDKLERTIRQLEETVRQLQDSLSAYQKPELWRPWSEGQ
jgi:septal ring factor EnvC (AmiA/AmiB activator)